MNDSVTNPQGKLADKKRSHYECVIHGAMQHFGFDMPRIGRHPKH